MSISVNGQSVVPPGFRFHPTEEELLTYYLKKKVASERIDLDVIRDVDLNKLEPWDIQEKCRIGSGPQNDWYFFSHKDKKYPTGTRTNRATTAGFWKATGRDKAIYAASPARRIGMRKTLVFYMGRAPHGHKSDWIMHEYRLEAPPPPHDDNNNAVAAADHLPAYYTSPSSAAPTTTIRGGDQAAAQQEQEGWVICRVFKKKNLVHHGQHTTTNTTTTSAAGVTSAAGRNHAAAASNIPAAAAMEISSPSHCSSVTAISDLHHQHTKQQQPAMLHHHSSAACSDDDALDHFLHYIGGGGAAAAGKLPAAADTKPPPAALLLDHHHHHLAAASTTATNGLYGKFMKLPPLELAGGGGGGGGGLLPSPAACEYGAGDASGIGDWDALDRLAAYELNGLSDASKVNMAAFFDVEASAAAATAVFSSSASSSVHAAGVDGDLWSLARSVSALHADLTTMNNV